MKVAWCVVLVVACSKGGAQKPAFGVDTAGWQVVPLAPEFKTQGTLRLPAGATYKAYPDVKHKGQNAAAGDITLPDGVVVSIMEREANEMRDGDMLETAFSGQGNQMLEKWRSPTGWVFIYKPGALKGEIAVSSTNFAVEPG